MACLFLGLFNTIFTSKLFHFTITCLTRLNVKIDLISTFQIILFHVFSMNSISFVNSKCFLGECAKYECKVCNKFSSHITKGKPNKIYITINVTKHTMDPYSMRNTIVTDLPGDTNLGALKNIGTIHPKANEHIGNLLLWQTTTYHCHLHNILC